MPNVRTARVYQRYSVCANLWLVARDGFWRVLYRCGRTIGHLTVGKLTVTAVPLFLFAFLVSFRYMDGKAKRRWLWTSPCDNEQAIALRKNRLRAYEGNSSELVPPSPWSRVSTRDTMPLCVVVLVVSVAPGIPRKPTRSSSSSLTIPTHSKYNRLLCVASRFQF